MSCSPTTRARSVVPQVEALEDRTVPVANFLILGKTLAIVSATTPDPATLNVIQIQDNGTALANNVVVFVNGTRFRPNVAIDRVVLLGGSGVEVVSYNMTGALQSNRIIQGLLGAGNDIFRMTVRRDIVSGVGCLVNVQGQEGNDTITQALVGDLQAGSLLSFIANGGTGNDQVRFQTTNFLVTEAGSRLKLGLSGDQGHDTVGMEFNGQLDGRLNFNLAGNAGNDTVTAVVRLTRASTGFLVPPSNVLGGGGDDILGFIVVNASTRAITYNQKADGGAGFNICVRTNFVIQLNCQLDYVVG